MMGRPTKLTPKVQERIVQGIRLGMPYEHAARYGGIDKTTFYRWLEKGEAQGRGAYRDFRNAVKDAEGQAEASWLATVEQASRGKVVDKVVKRYDKRTGQLIEEVSTQEWLQPPQWTAAAWKLERRYPDAYSNRSALVQNTVNATAVGEQAKAEMVCLSDEQIHAKIRELEDNMLRESPRLIDEKIRHLQELRDQIGR